MKVLKVQIQRTNGQVWAFLEAELPMWVDFALEVNPSFSHRIAKMC